MRRFEGNEFPWGYKVTGSIHGMPIAASANFSISRLADDKEAMGEIGLVKEWYVENNVPGLVQAVTAEWALDSFKYIIHMYDPFDGKWARFAEVEERHSRGAYWVAL